MNEIIIDNDSLERTIDELIQLYEDYKKTLEKINKEIELFQEDELWIGEDNEVFIDNNEKYLPYLKDIENLLNFYSSFLKKANNNYRVLEEEYSERNFNE